jgi:hypothetical protein
MDCIHGDFDPENTDDVAFLTNVKGIITHFFSEIKLTNSKQCLELMVSVPTRLADRFKYPYCFPSELSGIYKDTNLIEVKAG